MEKYYEDFKKYEKVRLSGVYNMITEAPQAAKAAGLSRKAYENIIKKYAIVKMDIQKKFGSVEEFLKN